MSNPSDSNYLKKKLICDAEIFRKICPWKAVILVIRLLVEAGPDNSTVQLPPPSYLVIWWIVIHMPPPHSWEEVLRLSYSVIWLFPKIFSEKYVHEKQFFWLFGYSWKLVLITPPCTLPVPSYWVIWWIVVYDPHPPFLRGICLCSSYSVMWLFPKMSSEKICQWEAVILVI